ncbi:ArsR/SmtB family transcription factor [Catelliglobosispora koreensis]|uniref:ArsR/SmtB family transcription factor n=1 Tax=Catelliglobosispora koreensis TaxID=129052 RepID=UPI0003645681|nr:helix-turn-helix domain-containing protein [Catelliglobosispora koreensis]
MLRIHFTGADLMRTRIASAPDPMWELTLSLHQLRSPSSPVFREWRRSTLKRLHSTGGLDLLLSLVPQTGYFPDFLTPAESGKGFGAALDAILSTPKTRLAHELSLLTPAKPAPSWAKQLAAGDLDILRKLAEVLQVYYAAAIEPYLTEIRASVQIDRSRRTRSLADGGYEQLLADMRPTLRWHGSVIEADYPGEQICYLNGRGLLFVPSFFCWGKPITLRDKSLPPVLVCPVDRDARFMALNLSSPARRTREPLAALVGRTRAAVLTTIGDGCTTGEIARRLDVSLATASEHATVLRQAGLVASVRDGNSTVHVLTPLASTLLTGL